MTHQWTQSEENSLKKLIKMAEEDPAFSANDIATLKSMAEAFRGWQYMGRFTKWIIFCLAALAGLITAYETVMGKVRVWLTG